MILNKDPRDFEDSKHSRADEILNLDVNLFGISILSTSPDEPSYR